MIRSVLARGFGLASKLNMARYDSGLIPATTIDEAVVISVGNIAVGGRGKSPLAQYIANWYAEHNLKVTLILRGYRGRMESIGGVVSRGSGPLVTPEDAGDEAYAATWLCPGVTVRVGKHRLHQARTAMAEEAQIIVLDDGFQHRRIGRNLDIACVSPGDIEKNSQFFPAGQLRESAKGLKRAHLLAGYADDWTDHPGAPSVLYRSTPNGLLTANFETLPLTQLPRRIHLLSGIEVPGRFIQTVSSLPTTTTSMSVFPDHHAFSGRDVRAAQADARRSGAEAILTTTKDLSRLTAVSTDIPILALSTTLCICRGQSRLHRELRSILQHNPLNKVFKSR
jgi:tetraacyldisaccharide 4'-kinase